MTILKSEGRDGLPAGFWSCRGGSMPRIRAGFRRTRRPWRRRLAATMPTFCAQPGALLLHPGQGARGGFFDPELVIDGQPAAYLGYYESTGDADAHGELLLQAERWLHDLGRRWCMARCSSTRRTAIAFACHRARVSRRFLASRTTPSPIPRQWEELGYAEPALFGQIIPLPQLHQALSIFAPLRESLLAEGYRFEIPTVDLWVKSLPSLHEMIDSIFAQNFAYSRSSYASFAALPCSRLSSTRSVRRAAYWCSRPTGRWRRWGCLIPLWAASGAGAGRPASTRAMSTTARTRHFGDTVAAWLHWQDAGRAPGAPQKESGSAAPDRL